jgi:hypothetical protein
VLKGFIIFLIATDESVSWSLAELEGVPELGCECLLRWMHCGLYQTRPNAPAVVWNISADLSCAEEITDPSRQAADHHIEL